MTRDEANRKRREYCARNREKIRLINKRWADKNKKHLKTKNKSYRKRNLSRSAATATNPRKSEKDSVSIKEKRQVLSNLASEFS